MKKLSAFLVALLIVTSSLAAGLISTGNNGFVGVGGGALASAAPASGGGGGSDCSGAPTLTPGVWTEITPPASGFTSTYGIVEFEIDPSDPCVLYAPIDTKGLWKSTNRGGSWTELGSGTASSGTTTTRLDSPVSVDVDPTNPMHLQATQGVRGTSLGFWDSTDGGATWTIPPGFLAVSTTRDVTTMVREPGNWNHILLGSHSAWTGYSNAGVLESTDGGVTWTAHPPQGTWPVGSAGIAFLKNLSPALGNGSTWLFMTDGDGFWRSSNSGSSWTKVSTANSPHGAAKTTYDSAGNLYSGGTPYPMKSTDNGLNWVELTGAGFSYWYVLQPYGSTIYTRVSFATQAGFGGTSPFVVSTNAGTTWAAQPGSQSFTNGPAGMFVDSVNGLIYAANWNAGLWVLKP